MKIKAVLFDLDGTLRDTRDLIYDSVRHAVKELAGPQLSNDELYDYIQHHTKVHQKFAPHVSIEEFDKVYFAKLFEGLPGVSLYDQAEVLLQGLHAQGLKLAIVSSAAPDEIETFLKHAGVAEYFDVVVGDDGITPRKPQADPVLAAVEQLAVLAAECVMVGDMRVDMEAAGAAGVTAIGITHGFETAESLRAHGATHIIDSLTALPSVLDKIE